MTAKGESMHLGTLRAKTTCETSREPGTQRQSI